jgi:hypothetical protein
MVAKYWLFFLLKTVDAAEEERYVDVREITKVQSFDLICHSTVGNPVSSPRLYPVVIRIIRITRNNNGGFDTMEKFLNEYINRLRPQFPGFPELTAHEIASAFLAFKFGLFTTAVRECNHAISLIPDSRANNALKKALSIVRENAHNRENSQFTPNPELGFSEDEKSFLPVVLQGDSVEDPGTLDLENALVIIWCVALITSSEDEEAMIEHRTFIVRLLNAHKKALGIS